MPTSEESHATDNQAGPSSVRRDVTEIANRRIAFCITDLDAGGAEKALVQIATRLKNSGWEPAVYCVGPEAELAKPLRDAGIEVHCYGANALSHFPGAVSWLRRLLREQNPALLQSFLFHGNIIGRIAGRMAGVPVVLSGHRVAEREHRWHVRVDRATRRFVDAHVCVSRGVASFVTAQLGVPDSQVHVIPNGVEFFPGPLPRSMQERTGTVPEAETVEALEEKWGIPHEAPLILGAGRLHSQKGFLDLIAAFDRVREQQSDAHLLIAGEGPQRAALEEDAKRRGLTDFVHLPGRRADLRKWMQRANVFVLSSQWEGMPNVLLEAMASGCPCVSTDVEGVRDIMADGEYGLIASAGDIVGLGDRMTRILEDPVLAAALSSAAQALVSQEFTWDQTCEKYASLYAGLIMRAVGDRKRD